MRRYIYLLAFFCVFLVSSFSFAETAGDVLRAKLSSASAYRADSASVAGTIDSIAGYRLLTAKCLEDLPDLKSSEQDEFKRLMVDFVRAVLRRQFFRLHDAKVKWGQEVSSAEATVVKSVVELKTDKFDVDWIMVPDGGTWRLVDVVTEGASMVRTWRRSFKSIYARGGWSALKKKLVAVASEKKESSTDE